MPRLKNTVPKYRLHKASGKAVVTLNGTDHYLGAYGSPESRTAYDRHIGEWLANGRRTPAGPTPSIKVEDLMAAYWDHVELHYRRADGSPTSEVDSIRQALKPVRALYAESAVDDFGPLALKVVRQQMVESGYVRKSINQRIGRIKRMFRWGVENELVPPSIYQALQAVEGLKSGRTGAREKGPIQPVEEHLVDGVQPHVSRQVWAMIQLQLLTAMRSGEVTTMRVGDLDMTGDVWEYRPPHHKTAYRGKERVVPLGPKAQEIIGPFLKADPAAYFFSPSEAIEELRAERRRNRKSPLTPSQRSRTPKRSPKRAPGNHYDNQTYGRAIAKACEKAFPWPKLGDRQLQDLSGEELEELRAWQAAHHWTPHQLRHAAATRIRRDHGLEAAQVILGHSRADVTQVYAESNQQRARDIMGKVG